MPLEEAAADESAAIAQLKARLSHFETQDGRRRGLTYRPRPTDVVITTTPKAGTTWMQQIVHQLRLGGVGDVSFPEISAVVPWLELAADQGQDLEAVQPGKLRCFKTHAWAGHCPPFGRTIVVLRHPADVLRSFYRFFEGWFFAPGTLSIQAFAREFWLARGVPTSLMQNASYFVHLTSWYERRKDPGVLLVCFEDLQADLTKEVTRVAHFLSDDQNDFKDPQLIQRVVQCSTYDYMKEHEDLFDEKLSKLARNEACGLPPNAGMHQSKIGRGQSGQHALPTELIDEIDRKWKEVVEPVTGCSSYEALRQQLARER